MSDCLLRPASTPSITAEFGRPAPGRRHLALLLAACLVPGLASRADDRTMSFSSELEVLPAPGPVVVDGQTDDWDLSAGVWSYNDPTLVDTYSVWSHLMWDARGIYFLARYHDLSPLQNAAQGKDFNLSWKADCYQARVIFDDGTPDEHILHVNMFHSTPDARPYMIVKHGGFKAKPPYDATGPDRPDQLEKWGGTMDAAGGQIVLAPWGDGKGYNLEAFWPWSYCRTSGQALKAGEAFVFGIEAMWGNRDGTQLAHRLADGIKDETVNRIFMFRARTGWGRAVLREAGKLAISAQQAELQKARLKRFVDYDTHGSVPLAYELPEDREVTIAIDDAKGRRVRHLFGQYPRSAGQVTDRWDCLDDHGKLVEPGTYTAHIVHHRPIQLELRNSVYSSATPPWVTEAGVKLWGSNHGHPTSVATRGPVTILLFTGTEGGSGIQKIDDQGIIQWTDGNEFLDGTLDDTYAYGLSRSSWQNKTLLFRFRLTDGQLIPFDDPDRTPSPALLDDPKIANHASLALAHDKLWALIPDRGLLQIAPATGAVEATLAAGPVRAVTDRNDTLYALLDDGTVAVLDGNGAVAKSLFTVAGLKTPRRLGVSHDESRFAISDQGSNQVFVVDAQGVLVKAIGSPRAGSERPAGLFVVDDLIQPLGADFDHLGRLWISEAAKSCKRVTCWGPDYAMIEQYWGQADYGAMSGFPLTFDETRFIAHGVEFKLDAKPDPWHRKTNEQPLAFHPALVEERGIIHQIGPHEYACAAPGFNKMDHLSIFKRDRDGVFRECVRLDLNRPVAGQKGPQPGTAWVDANDNGQREEAEVTAGVNLPGTYWSNGWVRPDLAIMTHAGTLFRPQGFTEAGVPKYDFAKPEAIANWIGFADRQGSSGTAIIDLAGNVSNGIAFHTVDGRQGAYPNRYGRHDAPAAQRGVLIAPFRTNGVVENVPGVGSITALGGDRGEWFLLSMDGLYLSNLCQDSKGRVTLDETFIGQESFGGFIWRDLASGRVMVQLGGASYRLMEVKNLETCVKETRQVAVSAEAIAQGAAIAQERQRQETPEPERLRIARLRSLPTTPVPALLPSSRPLIEGGVDVRVAEPGNPAVWWRASLAHDGRHLAIMVQVADPSPWKNGEGRFTHAFIGGDCIDLQLDVPGRGPLRLLVASLDGKPTAAYWRGLGENGPNAITYSVANNPQNATTFAEAKRLDTVKVAVDTGFNAYSALITVPLAELGLDSQLGKKLTGIVGIIYSDPSGRNRASRLYWHDKQTGLVSDVPSEARLFPQRWGPVDLDK